MSLYLIRHAHATSAEEDPQRHLSRRGEKQVRALARFLKPSGAIDAAEVWHSPLARSRETAQRLVQALDLHVKLVEVVGLAPDDDPAIVARRLRTRRLPLAIVGHEPHLSGLLTLLVTGSAAPPRFVLKKCAAVALDPLAGHWAVRWQVSPELLP